MGYVSVHVKEKIAAVTFSNPPVNAMSTNVLNELLQLLESLEHDENVRAILVSGEGRFFSAGANIKEFTSMESKEEAIYQSEQGQALFEKLENLSKPVIAVIHGAALGGALEFAMSCHIRLVSKTAKLGLTELNLGIIPGYAGSQRLTRYVGSAKALEIMLSGEPVSGEEAVRIGLANQAYEEEELREKARELAEKVAEKSPIAVKATLALSYTAKDPAFYQGVAREAQLFGDVFQSEDAKEGIHAFLEKRKPVFNGK